MPESLEYSSNTEIGSQRCYAFTQDQPETCEQIKNACTEPVTSQLIILQVYFAEPTTYWTGRFIALCDKLKTQHVARVVCVANHQSAPENGERANPPQAPFETADRERVLAVLEDMRSCCQSELALKSFEDFENSYLLIKSWTPAETTKPGALTRSIAGVTDIPTTISKLRHPWTIRSTSSAMTVGSRVSRTISSNKVLAMAEKANGLVKSKTTSNLAEHQMDAGKPSANRSADTPGSKVRHTRQPSTLSIQAQTNARVLREREERATRRADETKRRVNSISISGTAVIAQSIAGRSKEAQGLTKSERTDTLSRPVKIPSKGHGMQDTYEQPQTRSPRVGTTTISSSDRRPMESSAKRNASVILADTVVIGKEEALGAEWQGSASRELRPRTNRQSSGEMFKNMVTGGLKGVRRMGRSLTGRSELEELGQPFDRIASGLDLGERRWVSQGDRFGTAV